MTLGAGLIEGVDVAQEIGIRPNDNAYEAHSGATFNAQDTGGKNRMAHYEINNTGDTIDFTLEPYLNDIERAFVQFHTAWGETDYTLEQLDDTYAVIEEQSGFDSDVWLLRITGTNGRLRLTSFDTNAGVTGTQAAWLPFVTLYDLQPEQ